jgi:aspartate kinase
MALVVQKFGGTSLADADRIKGVAGRVIENRRAGDQVVVVVSAMGETTNNLFDLAAAVSTGSHPRELDMLLTAGERISMALVAMAIEDAGVPAVSFTGSQAGILTTSEHGEAEIVDITPGRVRDSLDEGRVVIVAGFQGVSPDSRDVTTLGRGGSDTSAVALAAALDADVCEIYTDVDGIFTADPRIVPEASKLDEISFDEMHEYAGAGAGVLMPGSVDFARRYRVPIHVRSSFHDGPGTWVTERAGSSQSIRGVAHRTSRVSVVGGAVATQPDLSVRVKEIFANAGITGEAVAGSELRLSFVVAPEEAEAAVRALHSGLIGGAK